MYDLALKIPSIMETSQGKVYTSFSAYLQEKMKADHWTHGRLMHDLKKNGTPINGSTLSLIISGKTGRTSRRNVKAIATVMKLPETYSLNLAGWTTLGDKPMEEPTAQRLLAALDGFQDLPAEAQEFVEEEISRIIEFAQQMRDIYKVSEEERRIEAEKLAKELAQTVQGWAADQVRKDPPAS